MSSGLRLRDYQIECVQSMVEAAKRARASARGEADYVLVIQPTGAGKTVEMLAFARGVRRNWGWRTLIIVPYTSLLYQTAEKIKEKIPDLTYGFVGDGHFDITGDVVLAIQASLTPAKLEKIPRDAFQVLICDEAHHAAADGYETVLRHFSKAQLIIGMTATYIRGDETSVASDKYFPQVIVWNTVGQLTRAGYLVEAFGYYKQTNISLGEVPVRKGEFVEGQLMRAVNTPERNRKAVEAWLEHMEGRPTAVFCVGVPHARDMAECFNREGIPAAAVWGTMKPDDYDRVMEDYESGRLLVLTNDKLLTEGWDAPWTSGVLLACPVTKRAAYVKIPQAFGRMLRPHPESGKRDGVAVELRDLPGDKRGEEAASVSGLAVMARTRESEFVEGRVPVHAQASRSAARDGWRERRKLLEELSSPEEVADRFDVIDRIGMVSVFAWVPLGRTLYMPLNDMDFIEVVEENPLCFEVRVCAGGELDVVGSSSSRARALEIADSWVSRNVENQALMLRDAAWRRRGPSEKQINYAHALTRLPKDLLWRLSCGQVADLIKSARALLVEPPVFDGAVSPALAGGAGAHRTHAWQLQA